MVFYSVIILSYWPFKPVLIDQNGLRGRQLGHRRADLRDVGTAEALC